jgi:hypothetical protein
MSLVTLLLSHDLPAPVGLGNVTDRRRTGPLALSYDCHLFKITDAILDKIQASDAETQLRHFQAALQLSHVGLARRFLSFPACANSLVEMNLREIEAHPGALFLLLDPRVTPKDGEAFDELFRAKVKQVAKGLGVWQNETRDELGRNILDAALAQGKA